MVKPIPEGFHTLTTQLALDRCTEAIAFFKKAFGAREIHVAPDPSGKKVWHGDLMVGDSHLFVNDLFPEMGGSKSETAHLWMYTGEVDAAFKRAVDAGCKVLMPVADMFWGDRMGSVEDPWGNRWTLTQHTRDVSFEEANKAGLAEANKAKK